MERSKRHGPNRLQSYLEIHTTVMGRMIYSGLVDEDCLELPNGASGALVIEGVVWLRDRRLKITVAKVLDILDEDATNPLVQTISYSYNVSIVGHGNVFRYCSPHDDGQDITHHTHHHRHQYNPFGPDTKANTVAPGGDDWPTLSEVIKEADEWYWANEVAIQAL